MSVKRKSQCVLILSYNRKLGTKQTFRTLPTTCFHRQGTAGHSHDKAQPANKDL